MPPISCSAREFALDQAGRNASDCFGILNSHELQPERAYDGTE